MPAPRPWLTRQTRVITALLAVAALAACGGGAAPDGTASPADASTRQRALASLPEPRIPDAEALLDWAERTYPDLFPLHQRTSTWTTYQYRYYPQTGNYVGVSGDTVAVMGPLSGGALKVVGTRADFRCLVYPQDCVAPTITVQPVDTSVVMGTSAQLSVVASTQLVAYQWYREGVLIPGAESATLTIANPALTDDGQAYSVVVANTLGSVTSRTVRLNVDASASAVELNACREITAPGRYVLAHDLNAAGTQPCITIRDVAGVQLDCNQHALRGDLVKGGGALALRRVQTFSVRNCRFSATTLELADVTTGSLVGNTLAPLLAAQPASVQASNVFGMRFANNTLTDATYHQRFSFGNVFRDNQISARAGTPVSAGVLTSTWGGNNRIFANVLDGRWDGTPGTVNGADAGVMLQDESGTTVEDNTISRVHGCGIEWLGKLATATLQRNQIAQAGVCGIGGADWASLVSSTMRDNRVRQVPTLFGFTRVYGLRPARFEDGFQRPADTAAEFRDNLFEGNRLEEPFAGTNPSAYMPLFNRLGYAGGVSTIPGERALVAADFVIARNTFRNNDFGQVLAAPDFGGTPVTGMVTDGGGNRCKPPPLPYPLACQ